MKRTITIAASLAMMTVFSGCASNTTQLNTGLANPIQLPELPTELSKKAVRLPDITDPTFGGIIQDATLTDQQYNSVAHQLNSLIDLYDCIRISTNQKKDPKNECLNSQRSAVVK